MSICSTCGAETARIRSRFGEDGTVTDECPQCAPGSFEKFTAPSDKKIWMGYEVHPNEYVKAPDGGYDRKPEYRSEQESQLRQPTEAEQCAQDAAIAKKRAERRTTPMTPAEQSAAMAKASQIAAWICRSAAQGTDVA